MPGLEQFVDEARVEVEPLLVHGAPAGDDARPARREPVRVEPEPLHERDVVGHAVVVVDGALGGVPARDGAGKPGERVPDRVLLAAFMGGALDLRGGGGRPPDEVGGPVSVGRGVVRVQPFTAPCMIPEMSCLPAMTKSTSSGMVARTAPVSTIE